MLIYRIQDEDGVGPYHSKHSLKNPMSGANETHPLPYNDSLLKEGLVLDMYQHGFFLKDRYEFRFRDMSFRETLNEVADYSICDWISDDDFRFGFSSEEQLRRWVYMDEWIAVYHKLGFKLAIYDIDPSDVIAGHTQCCFRKVEPKELFDLCEFFKIDPDFYKIEF